MCVCVSYFSSMEQGGIHTLCPSVSLMASDLDPEQPQRPQLSMWEENFDTEK